MGQAALKKQAMRNELDALKEFPLREAALSSFAVSNDTETAKLIQSLLGITGHAAQPTEPSVLGQAQAEIDGMVFRRMQNNRGDASTTTLIVECPVCGDKPGYEFSTMAALGRLLRNASLDARCGKCVTASREAARRDADQGGG